MNIETQTVTVSFFRYKGLNKIWGMKQMYSVRQPMRSLHGVKFFKPLGTGSGVGYSIWPDWGVYGLLVVWENEKLANEFLKSDLYNQYVEHSVENYSVYLKPISSRGAWSGFSDWQFSDPNPDSEIIAALTRATLKTKFLFKFWSMVPRVSKEHENYEGLLFTKGVGEIPLLEQATFSIWQNKKCMESFAMTTFHGEAVMETRRRNGFNEEMFTRLKPYKTTGTWGGSNPLSQYLT